MKNIFGLLALLVTGSLAATSALYLHHERSTQATVEADCQNREVCLDKINLAPIGRFNDGTLWHGVTQEKPNVNLTGTLTVTGATVLSNNLTLSLFATGRIPYTTTAGLLTSGTGLTYNGSAFSVTGTAAISGVTTLTGNAIVGPTGTGNPQGETADLTITAGSSGNVVSSLTMRGFRTSNSAFANYYAYHGSTMVGKTQWLRDGADDAGSWKLFTMPTAGAITERLSVNSIGDLGFNVNKFTIAAASGNTTIAGTLGVTGATTLTGALDVTGASTLKTSLTLQAGNGAGEYDLTIKSSRGTIGSPTDVVNGDAPFNLSVNAYSGGAYYATAGITSYIDGTFTSGQRPPSRMEFYTNIANGAQTKQFSIAGNGAAQFTSTLGVTGVTTLANTLRRDVAGEFLINSTSNAGNLRLLTGSGDVILESASAISLKANSGFQVVLAANRATTAGGSDAVTFGSSGVVGICFGSGAPTLAANKGALYLRTDGSATNNRAYINTDGNTAWTAITTAA
jgi:hypothetical protein